MSSTGDLVNLKAETVIQYFGNDGNNVKVERNKENVAKTSNSIKKGKGKQESMTVKLKEVERNATTKIPKISLAETIATYTTQLERENIQKGTNGDESILRSFKEGRTTGSRDKKETLSKAKGDTRKPILTKKTNQRMEGLSVQSTTLVQDMPSTRERFDYHSWYQKRTMEICGTGWQEKYRKLHADILNKRRAEKYLVYLCPGTRQGCCGYGNRLRAVVSLFYLSILTDRAFLIDWRAPEPIENHLSPRNIQWNHTEPIDLCTGLQIRRHYWGTAKADIREAEGWIIQDSSHFKRWLTTTDLKNYFDWPVEEITTIWYFAEGGITLNPYLLKRAKELGIKPLISSTPKYNLVGCAFDFLFSKSEVVTRKLNEMRTQLRFDAGPVIGIHIRTGDDQFDYYASDNERSPNSKNISNLSRFFECAKKVENKIFPNTSREVRWFVSTDNMNVRNLVQETYPRKVLTSNLTILHLDILFNTSILNFTAECNYTDGSNTTLVCYNVEIFNVTAYCLNRTNNLLEDEKNSTLNETGLFTDGIIAMLVDHFLLAESDFLVLCDSSFGSTAVGLSMRNTDSYTLADRGCADLSSAQRNKKLRYFGRR